MHAAAAGAATADMQEEKPLGRYDYSDTRVAESVTVAVPGGAVVLATPVAPPMNGDTYHPDISPENAILNQGPRCHPTFV